MTLYRVTAETAVTSVSCLVGAFPLIPPPALAAVDPYRVHGHPGPRAGHGLRAPIGAPMHAKPPVARFAKQDCTQRVALRGHRRSSRGASRAARACTSDPRAACGCARVYMWVPRLGTCRTLPEVWRRDTADGAPAERPPPRWARPGIQQRCSGGRLNPGAASYSWVYTEGLWGLGREACRPGVFD